MEFDIYLLEIEEKIEKSIEKYKKNISKISAGRANPNILNEIKINYYDSLTNIKDISKISIPEPRQLLITPFDKTTIKEIVFSLNNANLGVTISNEGDKLRLTFPEVTTQRRKDLVKLLSSETEKAKVFIRNIRKEINKNIKKDEELSEDQEREYLNNIQKIINTNIEQIEKISKEKTDSLMEI